MYVHENNLKRVIRALEYYNETGQKMSEHNEEQRQKESPYNFRYYVLNMDREKLYDRINMRVDIMLDNGLVEEVKKLKEKYERIAYIMFLLKKPNKKRNSIMIYGSINNKSIYSSINSLKLR